MISTPAPYDRVFSRDQNMCRSGGADYVFQVRPEMPGRPVRCDMCPWNRLRICGPCGTNACSRESRRDGREGVWVPAPEGGL